ncbi:hypothetical protein [Leptospira langatensis]|uniref:hypothetical protein n=1 Tax=Leptospira langatensis TaxID=2484983 RepID=UPI0014384C63|nr:hypothetical protein [Leptospira langatensis]
MNYHPYELEIYLDNEVNKFSLITHVFDIDRKRISLSVGGRQLAPIYRLWNIDLPEGMVKKEVTEPSKFLHIVIRDCAGKVLLDIPRAYPVEIPGKDNQFAWVELWHDNPGLT